MDTKIQLNETEQYHAELLHINMWNYENVYRVIEKLQNALQDSKDNGSQITVEDIANSGLMKTAANMAREITRDVDRKTPSKRTLKWFRYNEARAILDELK